MTIALMVLAVLLWCWLLLSCLPARAEAHMPMPYLIALIPLLWVPSLVLAVAAACCQAWIPMYAFVLAAVASVARLWPYWKPTSTRETFCETSLGDGDGRNAAVRTLRVMTVNCRHGRADADAIVREVRRRHIDVLATQETTAELISRLHEAGLGSVLPYHQSGDDKPTDNGGFNMLFSRFAPVSSTASAIEIPAADVPSMTLNLLPSPDTGTDGVHHVTFASAHPKSPMRGCPEWSKGIRSLGAVAKLATGNDPQGIVVVMGDLNSSIEHPSFRTLLASGFSDASRTQATHRVITFPSWLKWPHIELDHILFTPGLRPSNVESFIIPGTDHYALTATLTLD
ncbi:endonuclease/exonuclease/phosphatase family protein [Bifidobacterium merycicum]|uniref:Endonuclease/Exonuclease/phosphatase n=1 Tax=Bifidobacterium merycicum TaxID=78345 RepID=A0A087BF79_9BIFI|nr:endonuclease/exonuclease/phosphatase family protein [Bifidobacterium merycicum]KFI69679.1 endonuclease/Exonuclease/phosphatase [Bifidobacterium merycicum]MEE1294010.1 endonuclease/exonuclease/phosphatase family protein [Bifidobacterium merycicum]SHE77211.1 Metal-dependent hydrolase, endonuclease/exonuclease/phosphatase family [Bifidobacterium merycicum DSM 6492]